MTTPLFSLSNAIRLMIFGGIIAVALVAIRACQPPPSGMDRFAVKSLRQLAVLDTPPIQPNIDFDTPDGPITLADYRGQVVLLNAWATWCPPCVAEMPSLDELQRLRGGDDFQVVTVSLDRRMDDITTWYARNDITALPVIHDGTYQINSRLALPGLPTTILYDRNGREVARLPGEADWASPEALALVDYLIAQ
jgi:thiol-disulfide isomerase/thioredoxin